MMSIKHILVPTDFSDCANAAADAAILIAKHSGAKIHFLHLGNSPSLVSHVPGKTLEIGAKKVRGARANLHMLVRNAELAGVKAQPELVLSAGTETIENYISPLAIDLLVMGSHGATGIRETIIGSTTQHVIRKCTIPCLVIKHPLESGLPKNIIFASTFKRETSQALRRVASFAQLWNATLHLLFINWIYHLIDEKIAHEIMAQEIEVIPDLRITQNIAETNDKEFSIAEFANLLNADMIAVAQEQQNSLFRFVKTSLAEKLINHSPLPVLVVNSEL